MTVAEPLGMLEAGRKRTRYFPYPQGAVTDLQLTRLELSEFGTSLGAADLDQSQLTGLLTGPQGERHAGGFNFVFDDGELFESDRGLWVLDQLGD